MNIICGHLIFMSLLVSLNIECHLIKNMYSVWLLLDFRSKFSFSRLAAVVEQQKSIRMLFGGVE